ncbi:MAG: RNA polymerase sigma factor [Gemmatimonadaceae bacterium]|nr:RNA polymerase sigma factor [Gemmatimonadaceae bacterium]
MASANPDRVAPDERELVQRAKRGDVLAFEALYRASSGRVFGLCLRMLGDRQRATEALQDVFVRVWDRLGQFDGHASFATWLHRVCVNQLLEQRRTDARREARVMPMDLTVEYASAGRDASTDVVTRLDLERALPQLSEGARRVFVLHDMEGYGHAEIAAMLGLAESTVRVQLHRARKQLMETLER